MQLEISLKNRVSGHLLPHGIATVIVRSFLKKNKKEASCYSIEKITRDSILIDYE